MVCEGRCQKGQPTQTAKRHQRTQNSRQEGRLENQIADQDAIESEKHQGVEVGGDQTKETKRPHDDAHEADERRDQREIPVHGLEYSIEEQGHSDITRARDEAGCGTQPATNEEGESSSQEDEQIKDAGKSGFETRRHFNLFLRYCCAHVSCSLCEGLKKKVVARARIC